MAALANSRDPHVRRQSGQALTLVLAVVPCQIMPDVDLEESTDELDCETRCLATIREMMGETPLSMSAVCLVKGILTLEESPNPPDEIGVSRENSSLLSFYGYLLRLKMKIVIRQYAT